MSTSLFGCLVSWQPADVEGYNGLLRANEDFLRAIIRYSQFDELHLFFIASHIKVFEERWGQYLETHGAGKNIRLLPVYELPGCMERYHYDVIHSGDPYISELASLREHHAEKLFPITGRAHTLSDDTRLSRIRDLLFSPLKSCDAILCSSRSQKKVMKRLLSSASGGISDSMGVAFPYRGQVSLLPLGVECERERGFSKEEARAALGLGSETPVILCLGRISPADKMDLHPLLYALNDLYEGGQAENFQLIVAGAGDASGSYIQSLLKQSYELNLEDHIRFELEVNDERKAQLYAASDIFVSLADNIQESFGLAPVEAMREGLAVVLSDWNGYQDLIEDRVSGFFIRTLSSDHDDLTRSISLLHSSHASFVQAQGVAIDVAQLSGTLGKLLLDKPLRDSVGREAKARVTEKFSWSGLIPEYHALVKQLNEESGRVRHHQGREVGMPYHHVFGHYASETIDEQTLLIATDRGIRVLLQSEKGFFYQELGYLLDKERVRDVIRAVISPVQYKDLKERFSSTESIQFVLTWMIKYQLLEVASSSCSQTPRFVKSRVLPLSELSENQAQDALSYPEQRRSALIKPVVAWCLELSGDYLSDCDASAGELLESVGREWIAFLDERLLQAITWFADGRQLTVYGEILLTLEEEGGLEHLIRSYPLWYQRCRKEIFYRLKTLKLLCSRFKRDLPDINHHFPAESEAPVAGFQSIQVIGVETGWKTLLLNLDNGEKLVYKTRNLEIDNKLAGRSGSLAQTVNKWLGEYPELATHTILPGASSTATTGYGYTEYICSDVVQETELEQYHQRLGVLVGFSLLAGLADIHHLNVLNCNGSPYLIDLETVMHGAVFMQLERELSNPDMGFLRGLDESSLGQTSLRNLWESFHTTKVSYCSSKLVKGELVKAEALNYLPITEHCLVMGDRHSLDGLMPNLSGEFTAPLLSGFNKVVQAIADHAGEWKAELTGLSGLEVRYHPAFSLNSARKQLRDLYTSEVFQQLPKERVERYFYRLSRRITMEGEVSQRWLDSQWQLPIGRLAGSMSKGWLSMQQRTFVHLLGSDQVFVRSLGGKRLHITDEPFFKVNTLEKAGVIIDSLTDPELQKRFLAAYGQMLKSWLEEQLSPGGEMPEQLREVVLKQLGLN